MRKITANEDVMTTREAGETLGVAVRTVQLWVEAGVLPAWRTAGGHRRIARSAVEKLMAERQSDLSPVKNHQAASPFPAVKLLLVEDDPHILRLFKGVVAGWDFPVELFTATNGFEGLVRIGEMRPDIVVSDLVMPGMDGFEMLRALKKSGSGFASLKLLVVSALSAEEIEERGGLPDGVSCFQKPVNYAKLEALVHRFFTEKLQRAPAN
ncbi:MAG: response regulator [Rhodoferax sp.]|nr:response regulator [Rhodoferax sp.]